MTQSTLLRPAGVLFAAAIVLMSWLPVVTVPATPGATVTLANLA